MTRVATNEHPVLAVLEGAKTHIENAVNGWLDSGRPLRDMAVVIQWVEDGTGRVAPVDRDRFAEMIEPPETVRREHPNDANVIVAMQIAGQLRHRVEGFIPAVLNFDAEDGAVSRVVLLRFANGEMDVKPSSGVA